MKKIRFIYTLLIIVVILGGCASKYNIVYKPGKDTYKLFGDGTYQLLSSVIYDDNGDEINKRYGLFNSKYRVSILFDVLDYKKDNEVVYFKGTDEKNNPIFIILDIASNVIKYYNANGDEPQFTCANDMLMEGKLEVKKDINEFSDIECEYYYDLKWNK